MKALWISRLLKLVKEIIALIRDGLEAGFYYCPIKDDDDIRYIYYGWEDPKER